MRLKLIVVFAGDVYVNIIGSPDKQGSRTLRLGHIKATILMFFVFVPYCLIVSGC